MHLHPVGCVSLSNKDTYIDALLSDALRDLMRPFFAAAQSFRTFGTGKSET